MSVYLYIYIYLYIYTYMYVYIYNPLFHDGAYACVRDLTGNNGGFHDLSVFNQLKKGLLYLVVPKFVW
jgi:hypothetical protein